MARALLLASLAAGVVAALLILRSWAVNPTQAAEDDEPLAVRLIQGTPLPLPGEYVPPPVPTPTAGPDAGPSPTRRPAPAPGQRQRVGIIAGHWHNDSGAVCEDTDLYEVHVTVPVAERVAEYLRQLGYDAEVLAEFDPLLDGYQASVLVSIHADSCLDWPGLTGFKVARSSDSAIPEIEDRLVDCLYTEYEGATDLPRHEFSITENMTNYHAFRRVAPLTPSAIIELGFLYNDREVLTKHQDWMVRGVAEGIRCFLEDPAA